MKNYYRSLKKNLLGIIALAIAVPAVATPAVYSGTNNTGDFWERPIRGGPSISGLGPVQYSVQAFFTDTDDMYIFDSVQDYDGYLHVYEGLFDPLDQLNGLLAGDDDGPGGIGTSQIINLSLTAETQYYLVTSAFSAGQTGTFENSITNRHRNIDVNITIGSLVEVPDSVAVPEPGMVSLLGFGLVGLGLARRKNV